MENICLQKYWDLPLAIFVSFLGGEGALDFTLFLDNVFLIDSRHLTITLDREPTKLWNALKMPPLPLSIQSVGNLLSMSTWRIQHQFHIPGFTRKDTWSTVKNDNFLILFFYPEWRSHLPSHHTKCQFKCRQWNYVAEMPFLVGWLESNRKWPHTLRKVLQTFSSKTWEGGYDW